jgi:phosphomannomutase
MIENKIDFGAERTGHYYFKINGAYIDGTVKMALAVGSLISGSGNISSWIDDHKTTFRLKEENFPVKNKDEAIAYIRKAYIKRKPKISDIDGLTMEFKDFWFNVRPSADEDLLRVNMESRIESVLQKEIGMLRSLIREK